MSFSEQNELIKQGILLRRIYGMQLRERVRNVCLWPSHPVKMELDKLHAEITELEAAVSALGAGQEPYQKPTGGN
jgi:hypothetical protein